MLSVQPYVNILAEGGVTQRNNIYGPEAASPSDRAVPNRALSPNIHGVVKKTKMDVASSSEK